MSTPDAPVDQPVGADLHEVETPPPSSTKSAHAGSRTAPPAAVGWGVAVGVATAATPVGFWWLPATTVYAVGLAFIAAVYLGFAVADGRRRVIAVEVAVLSAFVLVAAVAITGSPWLIVVGLAGHGFKDLWQHRTQFVATTRWWPSFCAAVDWVAALLVAVAIIAGASFR